MSYSITPESSDCYENSTCLINKFGITDEKRLALLESKISFAKATELISNHVGGNLDFLHYKSIHKYLFNELYTWAGEIRTVNISKKVPVLLMQTKLSPLQRRVLKELKIKTISKINHSTTLLMI